ncbi:MAG: DUF3341 domain-containing protein [Ignavibacteriaceae bacterium]|nr:DUF3341 domain-containing protein [Ignavibacteriaceae bacterium]
MERTDKIYGLAALFDSPDKIIHATESVVKEGYKSFDVHTPYPVHGMDNAMKLKPSTLGYITLVFGLSGAAFILLFMYWTMSVNYPMIIGGKPYFALPAFIPVTFEVTVLLATLSTVIGMIAFYFKFPVNAYPLNETNYMKAVSNDKYGVFIKSDDPKFDESKIRVFLTSLGGTNLELVYDLKKVTYDPFSPRFISVLVGVIIVVSGGTYVSLNKAMYLPPFNWMEYQFRGNPQSSSDFFSDGRVNRMPVKGSVARGFIPYEFTGVTLPENPLPNPLPVDEKVLQLGKRKYLTFCSPCHGDYGDGDSRMRGQFPNPPSLHTEKLKTWADGLIYHVIVNGQNVMPSYAHQTTAEERWAMVHYVRALQLAKNASEGDIDRFNKEFSANGK